MKACTRGSNETCSVARAEPSRSVENNRTHVVRLVGFMVLLGTQATRNSLKKLGKLALYFNLGNLLDKKRAGGWYWPFVRGRNYVQDS